MRPRFAAAALFALLFAAWGASAADDDALVRAADAQFWRAYNRCDLKAMGELFTDDVEFYHDKTGLTVGRQAVVESLRKGPCADAGMRLRREAVAASLRFHPLSGGYAILSGLHRFHVQQAGKPERLDGQAEFTTVWQFVDGHWRMRRVLSYDHGPVPYQPPQARLTLPPAALAACAGRYRSRRIGDILIVVDGDHLKLTAGGFVATLFPESPTIFFAKERDLRFRFEGIDDTGAGTARTLVVLENGTVSERAARVE